MADKFKRLVYRLSIILLVEAITLCIVLAYRLDYRACLALIVFNVFFASLFFQLSGSKIAKTAILAAGTALGLFWSYLFQNAAIAGYALLGDASNVIFSVFYPILTLLWMVPFWSISLSFLPTLKRCQRTVE